MYGRSLFIFYVHYCACTRPCWHLLLSVATGSLLPPVWSQFYLAHAAPYCVPTSGRAFWLFSRVFFCQFVFCEQSIELVLIPLLLLRPIVRLVPSGEPGAWFAFVKHARLHAALVFGTFVCILRTEYGTGTDTSATAASYCSTSTLR